MSADPEGYYARLGVSPQADPVAIAAAFRKAARRLHPDVPGTGDAAAFVQVKAAYDVLNDPARRAAYDQAARLPPAVAKLEFRMPRPGFHGLPMVAWLSILGVGVVAAISALLRLEPGPPPDEPRPVAALTHPAPVPATTVVRLAGPPTHYVAPGNGPATLWRAASGDRLMPVGSLPAFTPVRTIGAWPEHGMLMIALADGEHLFVDAARLEPGNEADARQAYCADQAGTPPANAEVLGQRGRGDARVVLRNRGAEPAAVKLRDAAETAQALIYVAPGTTVTVLGLPEGPWHADLAVGEMWSRACGRFAAGMEAQRLPGVIAPGTTVVVPPAGGMAESRISDQEFMRN